MSKRKHSIIIRKDGWLEVDLTKGQTAIVDEDDYNVVAGHCWLAWWNPHTKSYYAVREAKIGGKRSFIYMHRAVMGVGHGDPRFVDHIDHNTTDNRKSRLKVVSKRENAENQRNQSKYGAGITYKKNSKRPFQVRAKFKGKQCYIGSFSTQETAQKARLYAIKLMEPVSVDKIKDELPEVRNKVKEKYN